jgi:hypothetical protein
MLTGKAFMELVDKYPHEKDRLIEIFNMNLQNVSSRSYRSAWFTINKQKCFAKKNLAKYLNEIAILKEKGAKLNLTGESLDNWVIKEYMKDDK